MDLSAVFDAIGVVGVVWLAILFAGVLFWAFRPRKRRRSTGDAPVPFDDDDGRKT
ncbi:MAG: cbb3-type cytochrome c oxidase subunit 3 [Alphaproteobacteria bacterium]|jgi:cbb3-type cytochrome oxidase subunit 3|nr:cbb3-type cytochrome c oxidase subunit 3 [Pseudomonadota bacterium]MCZ6466425.1 cbb3-type cytochrome c oxidase subunit 3 [Alphaproteobacteria bacterium]MCZ6607029.1 cbb3-type cytochrome c oxidase subunit 3 [Alphaproteobacteria bacterium]